MSERPIKEVDSARSEDISKSQPFVIRGALRDWPAVQQWSFSFFEERFGERELAVEYYPGGARKDKFENVQMPLKEFFRLQQSEKASHYYIGDMPLQTTFPELSDDFDLADWMAPRSLHKLILFMGRQTASSLHYHPSTHAILGQVLGTKKVRLYGPKQSKHLYGVPWYSIDWFSFSKIDVAKPNPEVDFPDFANADVLSTVLHPGDLCMIPVHWWHLVEGEGDNISVSQFWNARRREYSYPNPALRDFANRLLFRSVKSLDDRTKGTPIRKPVFRFLERKGVIESAKYFDDK